MANTQLYGKEARAKLLSGVKQLADAVVVTWGPAGRTVVFRHMNQVVSTKDGVTVAHEINLADPFESIGADLVKQAARQTVDEAGDGTTTATGLAHAIFAAGVEAINGGLEPVGLVRGIEAARTAIIGEYNAADKRYRGGILEQFAVDCDERLAFEAAKISANGDEKIAKVVAEAVLKVGVDGALTIGNSNSQEHTLEVVDGIQVDAGFAHPYFINDPQKSRVAFDDATILLINRRVSTHEEAVSILEKGIAAAKSKNRACALVIFCDDIDPEALSVFVKNRVKTDGSPQIPSVVIKTPLWADARQNLLEDLAILTKAKRLERTAGKHWELLSSADFGYAARVVVTHTKTIITAPDMEPLYAEKFFKPHIDQIRAMANDDSLRPDQIDLAKKRLAALTGGVAVIKVGGTSVSDLTEIKFRVEDAIHATRAAVADGVVPGGGSALLFAREKAYSSPADPTESKAEHEGFKLLLDVLSKPIAQIASNAGYDPDFVVSEVLDHNDETEVPNRCGFNAKTGEYINDMIAEGVVDPLRVVRAATNAAVSAAATTLLKCECVIGLLPENVASR